MDLPKFTALLQQSALVFPRADCLGDAFEGTASDADIEAEGNLGGTIMEPFIGRIPEMRQKARGATFVSCWHASDFESMGMWKLYGLSHAAVCIQTRYELLADSLSDEVLMGMVQYKDFSKDRVFYGNMLEALMVKRNSFSHEREARAIIATFDYLTVADHKSPLYVSESVNLEKMIERVIVGPEADEWFHDVVTNLVAKYGLAIDVVRSDLSAKPKF